MSSISYNQLKAEVADYPNGVPVSSLSKTALTELQKLLTACGHPLTADGIFGLRTKSAWSGFKKSIYLGDPDLIGSGSLKALATEAQERIDGLTPRDQPATPTGRLIRLPGISQLVSVNQAVYTGSNFTWAEMTKNGSRIPVNPGITENIVKLARYMDKTRTFLGNRPIRVNSAYRDPVSNRAVGGATHSRHLVGDAIDFYVEGENVADTFKKLKNYHTSGGLAVGSGFVHLDLRPGGAVRWLYPASPRNISLW